MGALIYLAIILLGFAAYPVAGVVYYKLIKHSKKTVGEIINAL